MASGDLVLGLDVGSGRCKAVVADADGEPLAVARRPMPLRRGEGGAAWYDAGELLATVLEAGREAIERSGAPERLAAIGAAGMAESGLLLDAAGAPLTEILAWFDPRGGEQAAAIESEVGAERLFAVTGLRAQAKQTLPRLAWLRAERPDAVRRAGRWAGVSEYVVHALTGSLVTVPSLAGRTLAYDLGADAWRPELLAAAGVGPSLMPSVVEAGTPAGRLRADVAARLGVRSGLPVAVAGHDHVVGAYAAGVLAPGPAADSIGTAEVALVVTDGPVLGPEARSAGLSAGRHVLPGRHYLLGALPASGALLEWLAGRLLCAPSPGEASKRLMTALRTVAPPSGLVAAPFLAGRPSPQPDTGIGLALLGLRERHGPAEVALAVLEGIAMAMREIVDALAAAGDRPVGELRLFGGGTRVPHWPRIRAAIAERPVSRLAEPDATALGAAWLGGAAAGISDASRPAARRVAVAVDRGLATAYAGRWAERYRRLTGGPPVARGRA